MTNWNNTISQIALWTYGLFIIGFVTLWDNPEHRRIYYFLVLPPAIYLGIKHHLFFLKSHLSKVFILFSIYIIASSFWSKDFTIDYFIEQFSHSLQVVIFVFLTAYLYARHTTQFELIIRLLLYFSAAVAIASAFIFYQHHDLFSYRLHGLGRFSSTNRSSITYGMLSIWLIYFSIIKNRKIDKPLAILLASIFLSFIILSQTRTTMLSLTIAIFVFGISYFNRYRKAVAFIIFTVLLLLTTILSQIDSYKGIHDRGSNHRLYIWSYVIENTMQKPIFGLGRLSNPKIPYEDDFESSKPPSKRYYGYAHNGYLATFQEGGIVGVFLLLYMLSIALSVALNTKDKEKKPLFLGLLAFGIVAILPEQGTLFTRPIEGWLYFWMTFAIIIGWQLKPQLKTHSKQL